MKKLVSVLLCLALLLSCAAVLAETAEKTEVKVNDGLTLRAVIPEGYEMIDLTGDDQILYLLASEDIRRPRTARNCWSPRRRTSPWSSSTRCMKDTKLNLT